MGGIGIVVPGDFGPQLLRDEAKGDHGPLSLPQPGHIGADAAGKGDLPTVDQGGGGA